MSDSRRGKRSRRAVLVGAGITAFAVLIVLGIRTLTGPRGLFDACHAIGQEATGTATWRMSYMAERCVVMIDPTLVDSELSLAVTPVLVNDQEVFRALQTGIPVDGEELAAAAVAVVHLLVDETGVVKQRRIAERSGYEALDEAALAIGPLATFEPAETEEGPTEAWVAMTVGLVRESSGLEQLRETLERWRDEAEM